MPDNFGIVEINGKPSGKPKHFFELLVVMFIIFFFVIGLGLIGALVMGNEWYTNDGIITKLKLTDPTAEQVVDSTRNIYRKSILVIKHQDGTLRKYTLDSDILFNYELTPAK